MKIKRFVRLILVCACVARTAAAADAPAPGQELRPGSAIEREIKGSQTDVYAIALETGEFASITVDQKGIDVVVRVRDANDKLLTEIDEQWTVVGQEQTTIVAGAPAKYRLTVRPRYPGAPGGRYLLTVAEIRPAADKDRWLYEAMQLNTTALYGGGSGKMQEARTAAAGGVELGERALGPDAPYLGSLLMRVAVLDRSLGHPAVSREAFQRAANIFEAAFTRNHPQTARAIEGIGHTYFSENDYAKAEALFLESQAILEKTLGPDHPRVMGSLLNMSVLHQNLEDPRRAIADLERALPIGEKFLDPEDFQITAMISNLGTFHRQLNDYDRAEPLLNRALQSIEKKFGLEHPYVATPLQELGIIARERKDYDNALALLWRAEAAREKALGLRNSQTADTMLVIASVHAARGHYAKALELQRIVLDIQDTVTGPYHNRTLFALNAVARTFAAMDDVSCAVEYQARMDRVLDKNLELNLAIGSEQQKLTYSESASDSTDRTISLHVAKAPEDPAAAELALLVLLQRKLRVLDAMSNNLATAREGLNPEDQNILDRLRGTTAELAKVALSAPAKTELATYRVRLKTLEDEKEALEAQISARNAAFRAEYRPVTVAAVREAIPTAAALIELTVYRPYDPQATSETKAYGAARYIAYVLRRHGKVRWIDLGSATAIDETIARWRQALRDPQQSSVDRLARVLDRKVMQPVRQLIGDASHLLISPDGQLGLVPFEALIDDRGRYLIERYSISYLMSGRDLLRMRAPRPSGTSPVVIADPLFGEPAFPRAPAQSKVALASIRRSVTTGDGLSTLYFAPLAGTREEARRIGALFPEARVFTGKEASKAALRRLDAPSILHVATHGFFLRTAADEVVPAGNATRSVTATFPTTNPLLRSGLALSGANLASGGSSDAGILTAAEASTLNLWGTNLVTLSACDSGVGEVKNREGVYGLRRAFFLAGAETVVMSLWPISDYVTRQMMTAYYEGLKRGLGRGEALRQAQQAMLKRSERRHPFYWASFILSGDWTPLHP